MPAPSSTQTEPAVHARALAKAFAGGVRALDGIDLHLPAGTLAGVIGGNGSGKTTLLRVLAGILRPDGGEVRVMGADPRRDRSRLAYAGQDAALDPEMTGWETLRLFHALRGLPASGRGACLDQVVDDYGLRPFADRRVGTWSGGQRQRLHLALEAIHGPPLLLLDEPTSNLDPEGRRDLWRRAAAWRNAGNTLLVATHDLAEVAAHCDRALLLHRGRLIADEAPAALVAAHGRARAVVTLAREPAGAEAHGIGPTLARLLDVREVAVSGRTVTVWRDALPDGIDPVLPALQDLGFGYAAYERHAPDLADAYFRLTGHAWKADDAPRRG
ncbi:MAG TPA: ABC transporter ATP-binding protein, partial [Longimicrobium sp.]|nr:ABC transporter ATP-binding protein [Longimicrobium sp.]